MCARFSPRLRTASGFLCSDHMSLRCFTSAFFEPYV